MAVHAAVIKSPEHNKVDSSNHPLARAAAAGSHNTPNALANKTHNPELANVNLQRHPLSRAPASSCDRSACAARSGSARPPCAAAAAAAAPLPAAWVPPLRARPATLGMQPPAEGSRLSGEPALRQAQLSTRLLQAPDLLSRTHTYLQTLVPGLVLTFTKWHLARKQTDALKAPPPTMMDRKLCTQTSTCTRSQAL